MNKQQLSYVLETHLKGCIEFTYNDILFTTKSVIQSINNKSQNIEEFIHKLVDSELVQIHITHIKTNDSWDFTKETFFEFMKNNTDFNFVHESLQSYLSKNNQSNFIIEIKKRDPEIIKQWLLQLYLNSGKENP